MWTSSNAEVGHRGQYQVTNLEGQFISYKDISEVYQSYENGCVKSPQCRRTVDFYARGYNSRDASRVLPDKFKHVEVNGMSWRVHRCDRLTELA